MEKLSHENLISKVVERSGWLVENGSISHRGPLGALRRAASMGNRCMRDLLNCNGQLETVEEISSHILELTSGRK